MEGASGDDRSEAAIFIDDTWAKTNMTRTHARCARGQRLVAKAPFGKWRTLTFLAALRRDGLSAPCVIDGPIDGESLRASCRAGSRPDPRAGRHCRHGQPRQPQSRAIRAAKAKLFFLPAYSPDLNPIEQAFAEMKPSCARPTPERSATLGEPSEPWSIASPQTECANYFRNAGYASV